jgi:cysteinyl-tRNA synthetase
MEWDSPWGRGFPGWHIECSAMSAKYLGPWFDIHCGGEDHIAVHHSNEIAQTQARHGTRLANFWMHGHFLTLDTGKMSKSGGDFVRLRTLSERGIDPLAYRYLCLSAHYRSSLRFNDAALNAAQAALERLRRTYAQWPEGGTPDANCMARFKAEVDLDLNLPRALAVLWDVVRSELPAATRRATVDRLDAVLGLGLADWRDDTATIPAEVALLAQERVKAREARRWSEADRLRDALRAAGWHVEDSLSGQVLRPLDKPR